MSILTKELPDAILVNGVELPVRTDYRVWVQVGQLFRDSEGQPVEEVIDEMARLVLTDYWPDWLDAGDFVAGVEMFYAGYPKLVGMESKSQTEQQHRPDFDFAADAGYIYSSFALCYHIRLAEIKMHWWEFLVLFDGLMFTDQNALNFVVGTRQQEIKDVPKADRRRVAKLKREFALRKNAKDAAAESALAGNLKAMTSGNSTPNSRELGAIDPSGREGVNRGE